MSRTAEAVDPESPARCKLRAAEGPVTDDACTQQRCCLLVGESARDGIGKALIDDHVLGVTTVEVPAGEQGRDAQVLSAGGAESARPTGVGEPRDAYPISLFEAGAIRTDLINDADHLMARYDEVLFGGKIALGEVQVGTTDTTHTDVDAQLSSTWTRNGPLDAPQWLAADWSGSVHGPCVHHSWCHS